MSTKRKHDEIESEATHPAPQDGIGKKLHAIDEDEGEAQPASSSNLNQKQLAAPICPYLDTIDRKLLDFDFEKVCSVSSSNINIYACLTCGKYFQGRASPFPFSGQR